MTKEIAFFNEMLKGSGLEIKPIETPKPPKPPGMEKRVEVEFLPAGIPPNSQTKPGFRRTVKEPIAKIWEKRGQVKILGPAKAKPEPEPKPEKDEEPDKDKEK